MGYPKNEAQILFYEYDFAKDGGAIGSISLRERINAIKEGVIIDRMEIRVKTALASGGAATVTLGNTSDVDGYVTNFFGVAAANAVIDSRQNAGALLPADDVYRIGAAANLQDLILEVGVAALTAGKLEIMIYMSSDGN